MSAVIRPNRCRCGSESFVFVKSDVRKTITQLYKCKCRKCGTSSSFASSKEQAIALWNQTMHLLKGVS